MKRPGELIGNSNYENSIYLDCLNRLNTSINWTTTDLPIEAFESAAKEGRLATSHVLAYINLKYPNPTGQGQRKIEYQPKERPGRYSRAAIEAKSVQQSHFDPDAETNYRKEREACFRELLPLVEASYTQLLVLIKNGDYPDFLQNNYEGGTAKSFEHMVQTWLNNLRETYACYLRSEVEA